MPNACYRQRGWQLLEVVLILAIISVLSLLAVQRYGLYQQQVRWTAIQQQIAFWHSALNRYYWSVCTQEGLITPPDIQLLQDAGYLEGDGQLTTESSERYSFAIWQQSEQPTLLGVNLSLADGIVLAEAVERLQPDSVVGKRLTFWRVPNRPRITAPQADFLAMYHPGCI